MLHFCYISVPQTIPVSVIPTVDGDNVLFQVIINVSNSIKYTLSGSYSNIFIIIYNI